MTRGEIIKFIVLRSIGNFLVLFAVFGVVATFGPVLYYEAIFRLQEIKGVHYTVAQATTSQKTNNISSSQQANNSINSGGGLGSLLSSNKQQVLTAPNTQFSIIIPKIGAAEGITPNVDPTDPDTYLPVLQHSIAHAKGSVFPGMNGTIYLFAHSTDNFWDVGRYNAVFYLLKDLGVGDSIVVYFENNRYNYTVSQMQIVDPTNVAYLQKAQDSLQADSSGQNPNEQLVLQTCWPPGTTWKRLLVFAKPDREVH